MRPYSSPHPVKIGQEKDCVSDFTFYGPLPLLNFCMSQRAAIPVYCHSSFSQQTILADLTNQEVDFPLSAFAGFYYLMKYNF